KPGSTSARERARTGSRSDTGPKGETRQRRVILPGAPGIENPPDVRVFFMLKRSPFEPATDNKPGSTASQREAERGRLAPTPTLAGLAAVRARRLCSLGHPLHAHIATFLRPWHCGGHVLSAASHAG
ncbi:hypothetical protein ACS8YF_17115, partial [Salinisphaera sp. SWV1]|uniref:hypothetical protein n=1 Tax=Salinisphaera sp. SWV1 TaxID=3454139 RepID=UPI003F87DC7B